MPHQVCHPAHFPLYTGGFSKLISRIARKYLRNHTTKTTHLPTQVLIHTHGPKLPSKAVGKEQNKHCSAAGAGTRHQLHNRYAQCCPISSSQSPSLPMSHMEPSGSPAAHSWWVERSTEGSNHVPSLCTRTNTVEVLLKQELNSTSSCNR